MSESEAFRRIDAARLVKRFPCLMEHIEQGNINLTNMLLLRDHLTTDNVDKLARVVRGKSKREVQELIAAIAPKPDVLPMITKLPTANAVPSPAPSPAKEPRPCIEPLAPSRHRLELTVSDEIRAKLERARDLMSHRIPDGNLETIVDKALDALLTKLEKEQPGGEIPRSVRREVLARDGRRCTFADRRGNRCEARRFLELDHIVPRARGGPNAASNLRVRCRAHNRLHAETSFGREHVEQQIHLRQRRSDDEALDFTRRALTKMGFRDRDVCSKLRQLYPAGATLPPLPEVIRVTLSAMV